MDRYLLFEYGVKDGPSGFATYSAKSNDLEALKDRGTKGILISTDRFQIVDIEKLVSWEFRLDYNVLVQVDETRHSTKSL